MKILMVNKFLYPAGGAETYMFKLGKHWSEQGHEVQYFGMDHPDNIVGNRWNMYTSTVDFHRKGIFSDFVNPFKIIYSSEAKKRMKYILEKFHPDVVHINNFNYQLTPSIILAIEEYKEVHKRRIKVIYTAHDSQLVCPNHYLYLPQNCQVCEKCLDGKFIHCIQERCIHSSFMKSCLGALEATYWNWRKIYKNIDVIVCPSHFMKQKLDTNSVLSSKTVVLCNFMDPIDQKERRRGKYVLYFGRYSEEKGIRMLLEVCRELPEIPFVFAGGGPLEKLIDGIPNVKNEGFLTGEALSNVIRGARFSVCPSVCNENCPLSVIESMIHGTPVLGSDQGGVPELIQEGRTGWLFPAGNKIILKNTIKTIWYGNEPEMVGATCKEVSFDTLEEYGRKMMEIYQNDKEEVM